MLSASTSPSPSSTDTFKSSAYDNYECVFEEEYKDEYILCEKIAIEEIVAPENTSENDLANQMDADYIIINSQNIVTRGTSVSGSYSSGKYDAGLLGYKYSISFDWTASIDDNGDYIFETVENTHLEVYVNYFVLSLSWSNYHYTVTKNTYHFSNDRKSVIFNIDFLFTVCDRNGTTMNIAGENEKTIILDTIM